MDIDENEDDWSENVDMEEAVDNQDNADNDSWGQEEEEEVQGKEPEAASPEEDDSWGDDALSPGEMDVKDSWDMGPPGLERNATWDAIDDDDANPNVEPTTTRVGWKRAQEVHFDVKEMNLLNEHIIAHTKSDAEDTFIQIAVAILVSSLNLTQLQREIYALELTDKILIKLKFDPYYMGGSRPTITEVGKIGVHDAVSADIKSEEFLFTWTLKDRLQNTFVKGMAWPPELMEQRPPNCYENLMEMSAKPLSHILASLEQFGGEENKTMNALFDENYRSPVFDKPTADLNLRSLVQAWKGTQSASLQTKETVAAKKKSTGVFGKIGAMFKQQSSEPHVSESEAHGSQLPITGGQSIVDFYYVSRHNWLSHLVLYAADVVAHGNQTCMICNGPLKYIGWKPSVCDNTMCQTQFNNFGLGFSLAHQVRHEGVIMDMYMSMLYSCVTQLGQRIKMCYPDEVTAFGPNVKPHQENFMKWVTAAVAEQERNQNNRGRINYSANQGSISSSVDKSVPQNKTGLVPTPDVAKLVHCAKQVPSFQVMANWLQESRAYENFNKNRLTEDQYLKSKLNDIHPLVHPLLKWLATSNRAYIRLLREEERFPQFKTPYQFVFANASPEKEMEFQRLKRDVEKYQGKGNGTIQAWHGSAFGNWHSIMRNGLKNLSNTKWMSAGAVYGKGIYLSPHLGTSLSYARTTGTWPHSDLGKVCSGMALCELINDRDLPKPKPHYVIPREEWVMTRFFFIFPSGANNSGNVSLPLKIPEPLRNLFDTL